MSYPSSTILIPELQEYFSRFVVESSLNRSGTFFPSSINLDLIYVENKSFITMLFEDEFNYHNYRYLYRKIDPLTSPDGTIRTRMGVFPFSGQCYVCDSDSTAYCSINFFNLQDDDFKLLDKLLQYRHDSTSVVISDIVYNDLTTVLSKLIYIYLDLKINHSREKYDNTQILSGATQVLETTYEFYVIEEMFKYVSTLEAISRQPS